jgi:hypothetical protein
VHGRSHLLLRGLHTHTGVAVHKHTGQ